MTQIPQFCPNCGTERRRANARFCHKCGHTMPPTMVTAPESQPIAQKIRLPLLIGGVLLVFLIVAAVVTIGPGRDVIQKWLPGGAPIVETPASSATVEPPPTERPVQPTETAPTATEQPATATPEDTPTPIPTALPEPTNTPPPANTSVPTSTSVPTPNWDAYEVAVAEAVQNYGQIKAEALRSLDYRPYRQVLIGDVLERQRRHICKYIEDEVYYTFSDRHFQIVDTSFTNDRSATVLASISESRFLRRQRDGKVLKEFIDEEYDAIYQLERFEQDWFITCFQVVDEDDPNAVCEVKLPTPNPCDD